MSVKIALYFNTDKGKTYTLSIPEGKTPLMLTKQNLIDSMDKILTAGIVDTKAGNLSSKKKAAIIETQTKTIKL